MPLLLQALLCFTLLIATPRDYGYIVLFSPVLCPVPMESSTYPQATYLVVSFLVAAQEIDCSTCIVTHKVGHDTLKLHLVNGVMYPLGGIFICTKCLREKQHGFQIFSIGSCTLQYYYIISHLEVYHLKSLC